MILPIASRFIAGERADDALAATASNREHGVGTILNLLGEHYTTEDEARADAVAYQELLAEVGSHETTLACISVKPSQLGLDVDPDLFTSLLEDIIEEASTEDVFVWVDMEDSETTDATLDAVCSLTETYPAQLGVCIQANLQRTPDDLDRLADAAVPVRLVKGAYNEPTEIAITDADDLDARYLDLMERLFTEYPTRFALGTHDPAMIDAATELAEENPEADFEFQMLLGVREGAQQNLAQEYDVWQYAPYGSRWPAYVWRRLREGRKNIKFILRAVLSRE